MMAIYTELQEKDIREIAGRYDLTVTDFEPIAEGAGGAGAWLRNENRSPVPRAGIRPLGSYPASPAGSSY